MEGLKIGVLELATSNSDNPFNAIGNIMAYACKADELGYSRFWLTEHHRSTPLQPYNNPEILMTIIAGVTDNIRVGSAGSLIGYYSPYSLAQNYKLLNNIFNNRIDFGLSKGRPENSHQHDYFTIGRSFENKMFLQNLNSICELFHEEDKNFKEKDIVIPPFKGETPSLWYLSNSYRGKDLAIKNKLNICRSLMHGLDVLKLDEDLLTLNNYREEFLKQNKKSAEVAVAIALSFSKTKEELKEIENKSTNRNEEIKIIPVREDTLLNTIRDIQNKYNVNEIIIGDVELDFDQKIKNLERIKKILNI